MSFLVDANVLSEATRPVPEPRVLSWLDLHEHDLFLSAVTVGELRRGVASYPQSRRRAALAKWLGEIIQSFEGRILPLDLPVAIAWGDYHAAQLLRGHRPPVMDSLVGATALCHGLTVATRNVDDFPGVPVTNPWDAP